MTQPGPLFDLDVPGGDHQELVALQDPATGLRAVIVLHRVIDGVAGGGIRRRAYDDQGQAIAEAMSLARSMSLKLALAEMPAGGAKAVILDHDELDVPAAYRVLGQAIERLDGRYLCGPDVGTGAAQLAHVREVTGHVNPTGNDPNGSTALGVLAGLRGVLSVLEGDGSPEGHRFAVQGLGGVGLEVARGLIEAGGTVIGVDLDEARCDQARKLGVEVVPPDEILATSCTMLVPCALGGILTEASVERLEAKAICGSANDQLASPAAGDRLHREGILYAPDILVNAGAAIEGVMTTREGPTEAVRRRAREKIAGIEDRVVELLERAKKEDAPSHRLVVEVAEDRLAERIGAST